MTDCSVCCEKFNKSNYKPILCKTCDENDDFIACQTCCKRFILDLTSEPKCMNCNVEWDQEFLSEYFTKVFINKELKEHKENIFFEKQVARLPETQSFVKRIVFIEELEKQNDLINKEIQQIQKRLRELKTNKRNIVSTISEAKYNLYNQEDDKKEKFTYKCPLENCNGYLDSKYECGICNKKICKDCFEEKTEDHECDSDKKETVKMLKKDTKPCPKCGEMICKIDGCDQMYCIKCHTAFSWRTGKLENGMVHNPEYYRYLRENNMNIPRNPLDEPGGQDCNFVIAYGTLLSKLRFYFPFENKNNRFSDKEESLIICNMFQVNSHAIHLQRIAARTNEDIENQLLNLRVSYILNRIQKEYFKVRIQQIYKKKTVEDKKLTVWNFLNIIAENYLRKICMLNTLEIPVSEGKEIIKNIIKESKNSIIFANKSFKKIGKMFNVTYSAISSEFLIIHNYESYLKERNKK